MSEHIEAFREAISYDPEFFESASDALWFLNSELERRAKLGDSEAIRFLDEINGWGEQTE